MYDNDKYSEISDISMQTDIIVFKGGLGLSKGSSHQNSLGNNNNSNITNNVNIGNNSKKGNSKNINKANMPNVTDLESQNQQNNNSNSKAHNQTTQSNQIKPNGFLSFRSKKDVQGLNQMLNSVAGSEETVDTTTITKQIIDKLGVLKIPSSKKKADVTHKAEKEEINKVFIKPVNTEPEETEKEIKNFEMENNVLDEYDNNNLEIGGECIESDEIEEDADEKNIFWNLRSNVDDGNSCSSEKGRSKSVADRRSISDKKSHSSKDKDVKPVRKEVFLSSIVCTLSRIEKGKAIFVSTDDFIFVLPALFVPRNLVVGNTYNFRISEYEKFKNKLVNINEIQKKHSNKIKYGLQGKR